MDRLNLGREKVTSSCYKGFADSEFRVARGFLILPLFEHRLLFARKWKICPVQRDSISATCPSLPLRISDVICQCSRIAPQLARCLFARFFGRLWLSKRDSLLCVPVADAGALAPRRLMNRLRSSRGQGCEQLVADSQ